MAASTKAVVLGVLTGGALAVSAAGRTGPPPRPARPTDLLKRAEDIAATIEDARERAEALAFTGAAYHKAGDKAGADRALAQALKTAETIEEDTPLYFALWAVVRAEAQRGNIAAALKACDVMENKYHRARLVQHAIREIASRGDIEEARKAALAQKGDGRDTGLVEVAKGEAKAGKVAEALKTMKGLSEPFYRWEVLVEVAKAQARAKQ